MISNNIFVSENIREQEMLNRAQSFLKTLPEGGIIETTYEDKQNPARFYGDVLGYRAVGVFDRFWEPDTSIGIDWKTGSLKKTHNDLYEIQGYILNELYKQRYDKPLKRLTFKFLADDGEYDPLILSDDSAKIKVEKKIKRILSNIDSGKFDKKCSGLCSWCEYSCVCSMEGI